MVTSEVVLVSMVQRGGIDRAMKACTYLASWAICASELGHDPTWAEYNDFWKQSQSTTAREVRAFKKCCGRGAKASEYWRRIGPVVGVATLDRLGMLVAEIATARVDAA